MKREEIVAAARSYLGVRFHHQGRNRAGLDCGGLLACVMRDVGLSTAGDFAGYSLSPSTASIRAALEKSAAVPVPVRSYGPGDVLLMCFDVEPQHIAIATDAGIIHSYLMARRVVEHGLDERWRGRILAAYSLPGVE